MQERFQIGEWQVDPAARLLMWRGVSIRLTPRAMDVLVLLSSRPGTILSADELLAACWPHTVRSPNAVQKVVTELRHALGAEEPQSNLIETVPKRGYRLTLSPTPANDVRASDMRTGAALDALRDACVIRIGDRAAVLVPPPNHAGAGELTLRVQREMLAQAGQLADVTVRVESVSGALDEAGLRAATSADYSVSVRLDTAPDGVQATLIIVPENPKFPAHRQRVQASAGDAPDLIDRLTAATVDVLRVLLDDGHLAQMREWGARNVRAYSYVCEARSQHRSQAYSGLEQAEQLYLRAIEADPAFALAYWNLGGVYHDLGMTSHSSESREAIRRRLEALLHRAAAQRIGAEPIRDLERHLRLMSAANAFDAEAFWHKELLENPQSVHALRRYGDLLVGARLIDEGERYMWRAIELASPEGHDWLQQDEANFAAARGQHELEIALMKRNLERFPDHTLILFGLPRALAKLGRFAEAEIYLGRLQATDPAWAFTVRLSLMVQRGDLRQGSNQLRELFADPLASNINRGMASFMMGNVEAGVDFWRDVETAFIPLLWQHNPSLERYYPASVPEDPRYQALLDELGFGRRWQAWMRERALELVPITGIEVTTPGAV